MIFMDSLYRITVDDQARWAWRRDDDYVLIAGDPIRDGWSGLRETGKRAPLEEN